MRSISKWLTALACLFALSAIAGNEVGNGGNAVVCPDKVELLDFYEARVLRSEGLDPTLHGEDPFAIATERIDRLSQVDPKSAKLFAANIERLRKDASFEAELKLRPIDDSHHAFEPAAPKCRVEQLAVFRKKQLPGEKLILINDRLWKKMDSVQKAGLLLHESIYWHLAKLGETDSTNARYLVSFLMSPSFKPGESEKYWALIKTLRLPIYH